MEFGLAIDNYTQETYEETKGSKAVKQGAAENALRRMLGEREKFRDPTEFLKRKKK